MCCTLVARNDPGLPAYDRCRPWEVRRCINGPGAGAVTNRDEDALPRFDRNEPGLTVLHVSDLQFGKHHRFADPAGGFDTLLRRLCDDLDVLAGDHGLIPDVVALTGDLAERGKRAEFEQVAVFCEQLRDHLKLDPDRLLIVPGNHDINRKLCWSYFDGCEGDGVEPHNGRVWSVAFAPDNKTLASTGNDDTLRLWDTEKGTERARLTGHDGAAWSVAFSPDGGTLASGGDDETVRLWDVATTAERMRLSGHRGRVWSVAFSPDGRTLASGGADATVVLWNTTDGSERLRFSGHPGQVFCVTFSGDGGTLASGGRRAPIVERSGRERTGEAHRTPRTGMVRGILSRWKDTGQRRRRRGDTVVEHGRWQGACPADRTPPARAECRILARRRDGDQ